MIPKMPPPPMHHNCKSTVHGEAVRLFGKAINTMAQSFADVLGVLVKDMVKAFEEMGRAGMKLVNVMEELEMTPGMMRAVEIEKNLKGQFDIYMHLQDRVGALLVPKRAVPLPLDMRRYKEMMEAVGEGMAVDDFIEQVWFSYGTKAVCKQHMGIVSRYLDDIEDDTAFMVEQIVGKVLGKDSIKYHHWLPVSREIVVGHYWYASFDELFTFWGALINLFYDRIDQAKRIRLHCRTPMMSRISASITTRLDESEKGKKRYFVEDKFIRQEFKSPAGHV